MLQTRTGKRTAHAALQIAVDMANEGLISKSQAPAGASGMDGARMPEILFWLICLGFTFGV